MPRPAIHSVDDILNAARELVIDGGPRAATIDRIVARSGAPKGSVYHRFATVSDLLAAMWIRAVERSQSRFIDAVERADAEEAAVAAALSLVEFASENPADARLLASVRREDLAGTVTDPQLARSLEDVNTRLGPPLAGLARRLYGRASKSALERTLFATVDLPLGAIRRHLLSGSRFPTTLRAQLEAAVLASLQAQGDQSAVIKRSPTSNSSSSRR
jgi:AcrR family transcriptional regulator